MTLVTTDLSLLTRKQNPAGSDILHLKDPLTGKDHYVLLSDVQTGQSYDTWDPATTYALAARVTFGFRLFESKQGANTGNIPAGGAGDAWWKEVSESGKPDHIERTIAKTAHGFAVKDVLYINGSGELAKVTDPSTQKFTALVTEVLDVDNYVGGLAGYVTGLSGLVAGTLYYAQATGTLGTTPTNMPVLIATSASTGYLLAGGGITSFDAFSWKAPVKAATTANIALSGTQTIDGISIVAGDRVLVKDQTTQSENGIYVCAAGAWSRANDANAAAELEGAAVIVQQGTANADTTWIQITDGITLGSSNIVWTPLATATPDATETVKGKAELANQTESETAQDATEGNRDHTRIITARGWSWAWEKFKMLAQTITNDWTFNNVKIVSQIEASKDVGVYIRNTDGQLVKIPWLEYDVTNRKLTITGVDDSSGTVSFEIRNQSLNSILKALNGRAIEIGGSTFAIIVDTGVASGSAYIELNSNQAQAFKQVDKAGNVIDEIRTTTGDIFKRIFQRLLLDQLSGDAITEFIQFQVTTGTGAGGTTTIGFIDLINEQVVDVKTQWIIAEAGGVVGGCTLNGTCRRDSGGTVALVGAQDKAGERRSSGDFLCDLIADDTNKRLNFRFTNNTGTGLAFKVTVNVWFVKTLEP